MFAAATTARAFCLHLLLQLLGLSVVLLLACQANNLLTTSEHPLHHTFAATLSCSFPQSSAYPKTRHVQGFARAMPAGAASCE